MDTIEVTIAPTGSKFSKDFEAKLKIVETSDKDIIDALSEMKVAPDGTIFLMEAQRAVFLVNNCGMFNLSFRILHPIDDDMDIFTAAWLGLEKFNSFITEEELLAKFQPKDTEEDAEEEGSRGRFGHQYARVNRNQDSVPLRKPTYASESDTDDDGDGDE